jgi:nitroreductase
MYNDTLSKLISERRTIKPAHFNGEKVSESQIQHLLAMANWAPTHKFTEPWRFIVFTPERVQGFCLEHAALYKAHTPAERFEEATFDKLLHMGDKASHIIVAYNQKTPGDKLPEWEEWTATACAIQNVLLAAQAEGIAVFWSTGGMMSKPAFKTWLGLQETDFPMGVFYLGRSDEPAKGVRKTPIEDKTRWER